MIDIESKVFDTVYTAVMASFPTARVDAGYIETSSTFPAISVVETNNVPVTSTDTDDDSENYSRLYYEVNIYTNTHNIAKSQARSIAKVVDDAMKSLKFRRTMMHQLPNQDRTIFRLYTRYEVVVKKFTENGNTVYQFYRR